MHLIQVRLRLPIVLIFAALVVGQWDVILNYWGRLTRVIQSSESIAHQVVSSDTEYFCPMDPGVVTDWPSKCGICNMALVRRKRGEALRCPTAWWRGCSFHPTGFNWPASRRRPHHSCRSTANTNVAGW